MTLVEGVGLWCEITGENYTGRSAIFLDRDGVIVGRLFTATILQGHGID
jgi:hypothetical protein